MEKGKISTTSEVLRELFSAAIYKRTQGRIARQLTWAAIVLVIGLGCWRLSYFLPDAYRIPVPVALLAVGSWVGFRLVCAPRVADFLIAVEAEMSKVSWPTQNELMRAVITVLVVVVVLGVILFVYDFLWGGLLRNVLKLYG